MLQKLLINRQRNDILTQRSKLAKIARVRSTEQSGISWGKNDPSFIYLAQDVEQYRIYSLCDVTG